LPLSLIIQIKGKIHKWSVPVTTGPETFMVYYGLFKNKHGEPEFISLIYARTFGISKIE
jgi:hypothetical protein